ncbi:hypothetical protein Tco_1195955 [Tanacetum coccineum]
MSDSEHSTVTYTSVSIPVEDDSDIGSPGIDGPPIMLEGPLRLSSMAALTDPEEDLTDYPADRDNDDDDDEDEDKDEDEEDEEDVPPVHRMTARISIRDEPSISLPPREELFTASEKGAFCFPTPIDDGESSAAGAARQDGPAIAREDPYSVARGDLYGFVDMVDVPPRCSTSRELDYGITDAWDDLETTIMYGIMEDARDDRSQLRGRVNLLYRDRPVYHRLAVMIEKERG